MTRSSIACHAPYQQKRSFGVVGADGKRLGEVTEPKWLSFKRGLHSTVAGTDLLVVAFVLVVVLCVRY